MAAPTTPYSAHLGGQDPLQAIPASIAAVEALTREWPANRFERSYGPGKWTARQVITHLAQTEMALGTRARMAVATPGYVAQAWDQNSWIALDTLPGRAAAETFAAVARMNLGFFQGLSAEQRARAFTHPEYGDLTVDWVLHQLAGHQINHLRHLEQIP